MTLMLILVCILLFILLVPIFVKVRVYANVLKLTAIISVSIFNFTVFNLLVKMDNGKLKLIDGKGRELKPNKKKVSKNSFDVRFIFIVLKLTLTARMVNTFYGGINGNSYQASMISGSVLALLEILKSTLKNFKSDFIVINNAKFAFNKDEIVFTNVTSVSINILLGIIAFIVAIFKNMLFKGAKKNERRNTKTASS